MNRCQLKKFKGEIATKLTRISRNEKTNNSNELFLRFKGKRKRSLSLS